MNNISIEGKLRSSYYNDYILFLFEKKTDAGKTRISQKRIIEFFRNDSIIADIKDIVKESESNKIKETEREFNLFLRQPLTTESLNEQLEDENFLKNIYNRITKIKKQIKDNSNISETKKMIFINDLHYVINNENNEQNLSDIYINEFKNSFATENIFNDESFLLNNNENSLITYDMQSYKFYFKDFVNMNNKERYDFFVDLLTNNYDNLEGKNITYGFIPIMKEINSGLTIGVKIYHKSKKQTKPRFLVITSLLEIDNEEEYVEEVPISSKYGEKNLGDSNIYSLSNYRDIEEFIQEQITRNNKDVSEELNDYYFDASSNKLDNKLTKYYKNYVFNQKTTISKFSSESVTMNNQEKEKEVKTK